MIDFGKIDQSYAMERALKRLCKLKRQFTRMKLSKKTYTWEGKFKNKF